MDCGWTTQSNHNSIWVHSIIIIMLGWVDSVAQQQTLVERNGTVLFVAVLVVKKYYWQRILPKEVFQGENGSGLINIVLKTKGENWIKEHYFWIMSCITDKFASVKVLSRLKVLPFCYSCTSLFLAAKRLNLIL